MSAWLVESPVAEAVWGCWARGEECWWSLLKGNLGSGGGPETAEGGRDREWRSGAGRSEVDRSEGVAVCGRGADGGSAASG